MQSEHFAGLDKTVSDSLGLVNVPVGQAHLIGHLPMVETSMACLAIEWTLGYIQNSFRQIERKSRLSKGKAKMLIFVELWLWQRIRKAFAPLCTQARIID